MYDIEIKNLTKTYFCSEKPAVNNLSVNIEKGSIITLLGPSGCGKSTTLRLIAGFERADEGTIALAGRIVSDSSTWIPPEKRGVGMVFQDYALFPHLNIAENVGFGYNERDKQKRVSEVLELVSLKGFDKRYPHELSGGQQQRVALARALTRKPVVVLLDEPFSNLDADLRICMRVEIKNIIKEAGATAIFVSHDQKDALAISDRIIVMNNGVLQQEGTPKEIYQYPENKFVATFVGQSNIIKGVIEAGGTTVSTALGSVPCRHTHDHKEGEKVLISIRPDSFEMDEDGPINGIITLLTYTGESYDANLRVDLGDGTTQGLLVHIHPEEDVKIGDSLKFKVLPDFVAVIKE